MGHAILERARLFGIQSADYIMASGHSGRIVTEASLQAKTGRIHDRTRTLRRIVRFLLHRGHRAYRTLLDKLCAGFTAPQRASGPVWLGAPGVASEAGRGASDRV